VRNSPRQALGLPRARWVGGLPSSSGGDGFEDQRLQHLLVYISELLDIEAALAGRVLAEL
jgi:hypothetical protein